MHHDPGPDGTRLTEQYTIQDADHECVEQDDVESMNDAEDRSAANHAGPCSVTVQRIGNNATEYKLLAERREDSASDKQNEE